MFNIPSMNEITEQFLHVSQYICSCATEATNQVIEIVKKS